MSAQSSAQVNLLPTARGYEFVPYSVIANHERFFRKL